MSNNLGGFSDGLLFSENYGENWICINVPNVDWANHDLESSKTTVVKFNPFDSNQLVMGGHRSIWYSDDLGQSWQTANGWDAGLNNDGYLNVSFEDWYVADIEFHPTNPGEVYASTTSFDGEEYAFILKSVDGGQSWTKLENANGHLPNPIQTGSVRIDFTPADPGVLYCMHNIPGSNVIQLSKSADGGITWDLLTQVTTGQSVWWHAYKSEFEMSDNRFHMAYYAGRRFAVLRELNGAWVSDNLHGNLHDDIRDIKIFNSNGITEYLILGTDGGISDGVLNSDDIANGVNFSWNSLNGDGLLLTQIYGGGSWNADSRGVYGTQDNGTFIYADTPSSFDNAGQGDGSFAEVSKFFDGQGIKGTQSSRSCFVDYNASVTSFPSGLAPTSSRTLRVRQFYNPKDETKVSITVKDFFLYQFDPYSCSMSEVPIQKTGLDPDEINKDIAAHCVAPSNSDVIYLFYEGTYWALVSDMLQSPDLYQDLVEVDPLNMEPNKLKNRVFRSLDGGETFEDISNDFVIDGYFPYQFNEPKFVTVDPRDPMHLYVGMKRFNGSDDPRLVNIYESNDGGLTWQTKANGMDRHGIQSLYYVDGSDEMIFAATDAGVYVWSKNESQWQCINGNL
ncbi:MAG: sialidase family protein, partial [Bacteroidota bacterium]